MEEENKEVPLLEKVYYEDCPGCKIEKRKDTQPEIPWMILLHVWIITLCVALPISSLFPFLYFMVRDFGIAKQEEDVGFYAGFIGSSYMFGRGLTSVLWGKLADRYGRKPVIISGAIAVVVFNTIFGVSVKLWMAILARFLLGIFCGMLGPVKAYVSEVCRDEHQALGMSMITTAWGIGLIIGPGVGGLLSQPAEKYPDLISEDSLFGRFPYLLPCLVISLFALAVTIATLWLPESLHIHKSNNSLEDESCEVLEAASIRGAEENGGLKKENLLKNWPLMSSIIVYCIFSLHDFAYTEIFSLWAVSPISLGGLSFSSQDVGVVLSITGFGMLVFQLIVYPHIDKYFGPIIVARICGMLSIPVLQSFPFMTLLSGLSLQYLLNSASVIKNCLSICIVTSTFILQNRAVKQDQRGAANGIAMTAVSISKAIGPACGGALLSWSEKRQNTSFFPGPHMVFLLLNVVEMIGVIFTFKPLLVDGNY